MKGRSESFTSPKMSIEMVVNNLLFQVVKNTSMYTVQTFASIKIIGWGCYAFNTRITGFALNALKAEDKKQSTIYNGQNTLVLPTYVFLSLHVFHHFRKQFCTVSALCLIGYFSLVLRDAFLRHRQTRIMEACICNHDSITNYYRRKWVLYLLLK